MHLEVNKKSTIFISLDKPSKLEKSYSFSKILTSDKDLVLQFNLGLVCNHTQLLHPLPNQVSVLLCLDGKAEFILSDDVYHVLEPSIFVLFPHESLLIKTTDHQNFQFVELIFALSKLETETHGQVDTRSNRIFPFSGAPQYTESIKSATTISKTFLPEGTVPRLAIGSVQADGPDLIQPHTHPELKQYFIGLGDNRCSLILDDNVLEFPPNSLVQIPKLSRHGVKVPHNGRADYIWIDMFYNQQDMQYLSREHIKVDTTGN